MRIAWARANAATRIVALIISSLAGVACGTDPSTADLSGSWTMTYRTERVTEAPESSTPLVEICEATWRTTLSPAPDMGWTGPLPPQLSAECVLADEQPREVAIDAARVRVVLGDDGLYVWLAADPLPGEDPVPGVLPPHEPNAELRSPTRFEGRLTVTSPDEPVQLTVWWLGVAQ